MNVRVYRVSAQGYTRSGRVYRGGTVYQSNDFKSALTVLKRVRRAAKQRKNDNTRYELEYIDNGIVKGELACYE